MGRGLETRLAAGALLERRPARSVTPRHAALPAKRTVDRWVLPLLLALALVVRLWAIRAGLPYMHHPDEPTNMRLADAMVRAGSANPGFFNYPSLSLYMWSLLHLDGPLLGWIPGMSGDAPLTQVTAVSFSPATGQVLLDRFASVAAGVGLVGVAWATARRFTTGLAPATVAALLLALSPTLVDYSRLATPDMLTALLVATAAAAALQVLRSGTWAAYLAAGGSIGLATGAKYPAAVLAVSVIAAAVLRGRRSELRGLVAAGAAAVAVFVVTTPYALLDRAEFVADLEFERTHYAAGHPGMEGDVVGFYTDFFTGVEGPTAMIGGAGVIVALIRSRRSGYATGQWHAAVVLAVFPLVYGAFILTQTVRNERTAMLMLPALAVLAAFAVDALPRWRAAAAAVVVTALAAVLLPALPDRGPSTWEQAGTWLAANSGGRPVLVEAYGPWLTGSDVSYCVRAIDCIPEDPGALVVLTEAMYGRYTTDYPPEHSAYDRLLGWPELANFRGNGTTIRVLVVP